MKGLSISKTVVVVIRTLKIIIGRSPLAFFIASAASVVSASVSYLQIIVFSRVVNTIIASITAGEVLATSDLIKPLFLLFSLFLVPALISSLRDAVVIKIREDLQTDLEVLRTTSFSNLDIATVESEEFQSKLQKASDWGIGALRNMFSLYDVSLQTVTSLIFAGFLLASVDYRLIILAFISTIPNYFIDIHFNLKLFQVRNMRTDSRRIAGDRVHHFLRPRLLIDIIQNKISKIFIKEIKENYEANTKNVINLQYKKSWFEAGAAIIVAICSILALYIAIHSAVVGLISVGALLIAYNSYSGFRRSVGGFFDSIGILQDSGRYARDWYELMDLKPLVQNAPNAVTIDTNITPHIIFKNVSFTYPEKDTPTLIDLSFEIQPGEKIALVGENGAGKTTLVRLLTRVYDPTEGSIYVDGVNLREVDIDSWRNMLSTMLQDFVNYSLTIRESIAISRPNQPIDDAKVVAAAELAGVDDIVSEFAKGYDQLLWKGFKDGVELSRGQFQRIAAARIFYKDARINIFDEPTSAIDALAEEKIFNAIEKNLVGKSAVLISHRFSTVKNVDKIVFLEHGKILELGTHQELMQKHGRYEELYTMQASRYLETE